MLAIMASYVLALLTDRVLLVDIGNSIELRDLYCEPFSASSWAVPKHMLSHGIFQMSARDIPMASDIRANETKIIKVARLYTSKSRLKQIYNYLGFTYIHFRLGFAEETYSSFPLTCGEDLVEKWKHVEILHVMRGSNYFITLLFSNPRCSYIHSQLYSACFTNIFD